MSDRLASLFLTLALASAPSQTPPPVPGCEPEPEIKAQIDAILEHLKGKVTFINLRRGDPPELTSFPLSLAVALFVVLFGGTGLWGLLSK